MAGILNDRLEGRTDQLLAYVQRKLLDLATCSAEMQPRMINEIADRVASEAKVLLNNAISILSQDYISKHSGDSDRLGRYLDSSIEKEIREQCQLECDIARMVKRLHSHRDVDVKASGVGVLGAATGAFIARRFALTWLSPQVAIGVFLSAAFCYLGTRALLVRCANQKREDAAKEVAREFGLIVSDWLAGIEEKFNNRVSSI